MIRLLRANFARLWKTKVFWLCMAAMLIYSVVYMQGGVRKAAADISEYSYCIDDYYFHFALITGIFCALFCSMFLGTEYSDGTIRNKLIAGHTRTALYLASLITVFAATLLMLLVWLLGALSAVPALGFWKMGIPRLLEYLLLAAFFTAALSAIFTAVNMLTTSKAAAVALSLLLALGLLLLASVLYNALSQPEMAGGVVVTVNGMEMADPTPNPAYVSGRKREIYEFIMDFLPTGQGIRMWLLEITRPVRMLLSSAFITVFTTVCGLSLFKRKNLN